MNKTLFLAAIVTAFSLSAHADGLPGSRLFVYYDSVTSELHDLLLPEVKTDDLKDYESKLQNENEESPCGEYEGTSQTVRFEVKDGVYPSLLVDGKETAYKLRSLEIAFHKKTVNGKCTLIEPAMNYNGKSERADFHSNTLETENGEYVTELSVDISGRSSSSLYACDRDHRNCSGTPIRFK